MRMPNDGRVVIKCRFWASASLWRTVFGASAAVGSQRRPNFLRALTYWQGKCCSQRADRRSCGKHLVLVLGIHEVYIAILTAMGLCSQLVSVFSRKPTSATKAMAVRDAVDRPVGFMVWGHHLS